MLPRLTLVLLAFALLASAPVGAQDDVAAAIKTTLERHAAVVVPIQIKVAVEIQGRRQEVDNRILGTLVDANGLVMAARDAVDPTPTDPRMRDQIKITPLLLQVLLDEGKTPLPARIVHSDPTLGLAFLQIDMPKKAKALPHLNLEATTKASLGQRLYGPARLDAGFGHAPFVSMKRITGRIKTPREAWLTAGEGVPGLPSFAADGKLVGVHIPVTPPSPPSGPSGRSDGTRTFLVDATALKGPLKAARISAAALREAQADTDADTPAKKKDEKK